VSCGFDQRARRDRKRTIKKPREVAREADIDAIATLDRSE